MLRRGEPTPRRDGRRGELYDSPFRNSFEQKPMDPFPGSELFPNRDNDVMQTQSNPTEPLDVAARSAELEQIIEDAQSQLNDLRAKNDDAESRPSNAASRGESAGLRITKKVVGWGLGVGVTLLAGVFIYGRLQAAGVDTDAVADALQS